MSLLNIAESLSRLPRTRVRRARIISQREGEDTAPAVLQLRRQLSAEGFSLIGNGEFSIVLKHKDWPGRVLKISTRHGLEDEDGDMMDDGAVRYWQYCLENRGKKGKHLPVVYATGKLMFAGACVPYVWMKEYEAGDPDERVCLQHLTDWREDYYQRARQRAAHAENNIDSDSWFRILQDASRLGCPDFHDENMMYDPDLDTYIITDPVC